jgi:hypothetical protein
MVRTHYIGTSETTMLSLTPAERAALKSSNTLKRFSQRDNEGRQKLIAMRGNDLLTQYLSIYKLLTLNKQSPAHAFIHEEVTSL